jgi:hypothetical protein
MKLAQIASAMARAALASSFCNVVASVGAVSRDAAWREINIMRRLVPPRPGNREGKCLFD